MYEFFSFILSLEYLKKEKDKRDVKYPCLYDFCIWLFKMQDVILSK